MQSLQKRESEERKILSAAKHGTWAGKSTLTNLAPRFYDVSAGRVLIDGVDVRGIAHDTLLAQVGIVPQDTILFSGTVRDNIRYGSPEA